MDRAHSFDLADREQRKVRGIGTMFPVSPDAAGHTLLAPDVGLRRLHELLAARASTIHTLIAILLVFLC